MRDALFAYEPLVRLAAFAGVFGVMAVWELLRPRRRQATGRNWRWPNNLGVLAVDVVLVRILLPITAVGLALIAEARGFGLFNLIALPRWASIIISVILLDLAIYLQHVLFHAVPAASHASCRPRDRRDHRRAISPHRNFAVDCDQAYRRRGAGDASGRRSDLRSAAQCDLDVQPQQRPHSCANRSGAALVCRDAGHASRPSFDPAARDQQQFRL